MSGEKIMLNITKEVISIVSNCWIMDNKMCWYDLSLFKSFYLIQERIKKCLYSFFCAKSSQYVIFHNKMYVLPLERSYSNKDIPS